MSEIVLGGMDYQTALDVKIASKKQELDGVTAAIANLYAETEQLSTNPLGTAEDGALVKAHDVNNIKRQVALIRNKAMDLQDEAKNKQMELKRLIEEKMALAKIELDPLQKLLAKLEECVWTFNLYLGKDEEITTLYTGARADDNEPISIRQRVLFMDEEAAINSEEGGLDSLNIAQFDEWLMQNPQHLDLIMPEKKSVVVLRARYNAKEYENPWQFQAASEGNRIAHFFFRNGENVYRMSTDFTIGLHLTPKRNEFLSFFKTTRWNSVTKQTEEVELVPGTPEYQKAEEASEARQRHYYRVALILQGIIDRTPIFHPLPAETVRVTALESYEKGYLRIIDDAEMVLGDHKPSWPEFMREKNANMRVGMRVIGTFSPYQRDRDRQSNPKAYSPKDNVAHILSKEVGEGTFQFKYQNNGMNYRTGQNYTNSVSYTVYHTDRDIICLDTLTPEEIDYYLQSRKDRPHYLHMLKLLKTAKKVLQEEKEAEIPFRNLLVSTIATSIEGLYNHIDPEDEADDLILWYKTKNKLYRPLLRRTEANAGTVEWEAIIRELTRRITEYEAQRKKNKNGEYDLMRSYLQRRYPTAVLIAHDKGRTYKVVTPQEGSKLFVTLSTVVMNGNIPDERHEEWVLPRKAMRRWYVLYENGFAEYDLFVKAEDHLTPPERKFVADNALAQVVGWLKSYTWQQERFASIEEGGFFYTVQHDGGHCTVYRKIKDAVINEDYPITDNTAYPTIYQYNVGWTKSKRGVVSINISSQGSMSSQGMEKKAWKNAKVIDFSDYYQEVAERTIVVVNQDETIEADLCRQIDTVSRVHSREHKIWTIVQNIYRNMCTEWDERFYQSEYQKFLDDFNDASRWEGHKKTLRTPKFPIEQGYHWGRTIEHITFEFGIPMMLESGHIIEGLTFQEIHNLTLGILNGPLTDYPKPWREKVQQKLKSYGETSKYMLIPRGVEGYKIICAKP